MQINKLHVVISFRWKLDPVPTIGLFLDFKKQGLEQAIAYILEEEKIRTLFWLLLRLYSPLLGLGRFLIFLILYKVGRTPLTGDQPVTRPYLHTELTHIIQTSMP
jgi:hypothetical protein